MENKKRLVKILSIDGGGVRGIIPALTLSNLEARLPTGKSLTDCFDIFTGTSVGGILALLLNVRGDEEGNTSSPKYTASFIAGEIDYFLKKTFTRSIFQKIKTANGWVGPKYNEEALGSVLQGYFGNSVLGDCIKQTIIPAYEITENRTVFFDTTDLIYRNFNVMDIARATSAAPTYFKPKKIKVNNYHELTLIDGGISVNNPALSAAIYAKSLYGEDVELLVVSLGTGTTHCKRMVCHLKVKDANSLISSGKIGWSNDIISLILDSEECLIGYEMEEYMKGNQYYRLQADGIDINHYDIDDVSDNNLEYLKRTAEALCVNNDSNLRDIARKISEGEKE